MPPWEIEVALEGLYLKNKALWEATRCLIHIVAQVNSTETINTKDFMIFPWEEKINPQETDDRYEAMKQEMSNYIKKWNNHASGFSDPAMAGK